MQLERPSGDEKFNSPLGYEVTMLGNSFVSADGDLFPLCSMCKKSRLTCENDYIRRVRDPNEPLKDITFDLDDGTIHTAPMAKMIDGVEAGIIKSEEDIPIPLVCEWFDMKELG